MEPLLVNRDLETILNAFFEDLKAIDPGYITRFEHNALAAIALELHIIRKILIRAFPVT